MAGNSVIKLSYKVGWYRVLTLLIFRNRFIFVKGDYMNFIREFLFLFIILYIFNYVILYLYNKKFNKNKNVSLIFYLKKIYGINLNKNGYSKLIWLFAFLNSFIIDTTYIIIFYLLNNLILRFIFGIILIILLTIVCYGIFARLYLLKEGKKDV